mmetsp:Transcript_14132/g.27084  ORF Transcript_14132/g.27084 Transcript_14132/m.27084 type:complete len:98 (+) Transcript_14132:646-939(+)
MVQSQRRLISGLHAAFRKTGGPERRLLYLKFLQNREKHAVISFDANKKVLHVSHMTIVNVSSIYLASGLGNMANDSSADSKDVSLPLRGPIRSQAST